MDADGFRTPTKIPDPVTPRKNDYMSPKIPMTPPKTFITAVCFKYLYTFFTFNLNLFRTVHQQQHHLNTDQMAVIVIYHYESQLKIGK